MKRQIRRALAVILCTLLFCTSIPLTASAETYSGNCGVYGDNVTWTLDTDTGTLTISGEGEMADYYEGGDFDPWIAYELRTAIKAVIIHDGVTSIGANAFNSWYNLESITLPNSMISLGWSALSGCVKLESITIPDSVSTISAQAFSYCQALTSVVIPKGITSIEKTTFAGCIKLENVSLPDSVTSIGVSAFNGCESLSRITIPDSVTVIEGRAFEGCKKLENVTLGQGVETIGSSAFSGCVSLANVKLPDSVTDIGDGVFGSCTHIKKAILSNSMTSISWSAFYGCSSLMNVHIPSSVTAIYKNAFDYCTDLQYICSDTQDCYAKTFAEENGIEFRVCEGHEEEECPHDYTSAVTTEPKCTATGERTYTCTLCGDSYTETIAALGHDYAAAVTKEATCKEAGETTYTCSRCGDNYTEPIEKKAHTPQAVTEPATCTEAGRQYDKCSVCGETVGDVTALPALGHDFGEWVTVTEPTTEAEGLQERTCARCGEKETQALPKIPTKTVEDNGSGIMLTYPENAYEGDVQLQIEQVFSGGAFELVDQNSEKSAVYDVTTTVNGVSVQPNGKVTVRIPVPAGFDGAKCAVYHVAGGKLEKMNARYENGYMVFETSSFSVYAVVIEKAVPPTVAIRNFTENKTVDYRATVTFTADVTNGVSGGAVHWFIDGKDVGTGETYTVKEAKKSYTVQAKYVKGMDVLAETGTEKVTVKTGFFARLKAFFRALFGRLPKEVQEAYDLDRFLNLLP